MTDYVEVKETDWDVVLQIVVSFSLIIFVFFASFLGYIDSFISLFAMFFFTLIFTVGLGRDVDKVVRLPVKKGRC